MHRPALNKICRPSELPYLETRYASNSENCYLRHSHPTFSLGVVEMGQSHHYQDGCTQVIGPGAVVATHADIIHSCNPLPDQRWSYHMLYLDVDWMTSLARQMQDVLKISVSGHPQVREVFYDSALHQKIIMLNQGLLNSASALETQSCLIALISGLLHHYGRDGHNEAEIKNHPAVLQARDYLHEHPDTQVTLETLAAIAQLSPYHLIRLFKQQVGLTPHAYQVNVRINHAKELLRASQPIADVAVKTAFSDQAHFQRSFKKHTAMTPAQFQQSLN